MLSDASGRGGSRTCGGCWNCRRVGRELSRGHDDAGTHQRSGAVNSALPKCLLWGFSDQNLEAWTPTKDVWGQCVGAIPLGRRWPQRTNIANRCIRCGHPPGTPVEKLFPASGRTVIRLQPSTRDMRQLERRGTPEGAAKEPRGKASD